jgi:hypothetical protein
MIADGNTRKNHTRLSASADPGDEETPHSRKNDLPGSLFCQSSTFGSGTQFEKNSFLKERRGNVIENKGPRLKTGVRSGNVYENKGT